MKQTCHQKDQWRPVFRYSDGTFHNSVDPHTDERSDENEAFVFAKEDEQASLLVYTPDPQERPPCLGGISWEECDQVMQYLREHPEIQGDYDKARLVLYPKVPFADVEQPCPTPSVAS